MHFQFWRYASTCKSILKESKMGLLSRFKSLAVITFLLPISIGMFLSCNSSSSSSSSSSYSFDLFPGGVPSLPRTYVAHKATEPISIDGKALEKDWEQASWSEEFIDIEGDKTPKFDTRFKMLWDEEYMYYYVEMEEPHVWGNLMQRDTIIYLNPDFEIFWDPDGDGHDYYEFEINALNTHWDLFLNMPYREKNKIIDSWDIRGLKSAIVVNGTINNPSDTDKGWQLEIAVPWTAFKKAFWDDNVPVNNYWRINFSRVNWDFDLVNGRYDRKKADDGKYLPEYNWVWSPQWAIDMHRPEHWGYVFFADKHFAESENASMLVKIDDGIEFKIPESEYIRYHLFYLYRNLKNISKNLTHLDKKVLKNIPGYELEYRGHRLTPVFESHASGWNIYIKYPEKDGKIYLITNEGQYRQI